MGGHGPFRGLDAPRALTLFITPAEEKQLMIFSSCSRIRKGESRSMNRLSILCAALLLSPLIVSAQEVQTLQVQLHYTGAGTVDAQHKIYVALWDSAGFTANNAPPFAVKAATSKNGVVTFSDVK